MHPTDKQLYHRSISDDLSALEREDALGQSSQAVVTLDQQSVGRLSRMDALQSQAMAQVAQNRRHRLQLQTHPQMAGGFGCVVDRVDAGDCRRFTENGPLLTRD